MSEEALGLEASRQGETAFLRASGELDLVSVDDFRAAVREARVGAEEIVLDLRDLTFIDSSALSALVEVRHAVASEGKLFRVRASEDGPVRTAVELTGLGDLLTS